ncbi:MAG: RtcB family protein [Gammaproteobacteria bacterium]|nr:RtcB family protein [Gammaproteobacteria bacterium]
MIDNVDETTVRQLYTMLNHPAFGGGKIVIMPDCHAGAGAVIGFTKELNEYVIPNIVGVDIGCGVVAYNLGKVKPELQPLDRFIKDNVPAGFNHRKTPVPDSMDRRSLRDTCNTLGESYEKVIRQLGTLGGGNHFIEVDFNEDTGNYWLVIHTGSRNFGLRVAQFHQKKAREQVSGYKDLEYMSMGSGGKDYIHDMTTAQDFASENRFWIAAQIIGYLGLKIAELEKVESVHNYISPKDDIIRKGAISAYEGERVIIPFNMRDGVAIGKGKGNPNWNYSAPHGAGRIMSRGQARRSLDIEEFSKEMAGIFSTTVNTNTLDEAPGAYKDKSVIVEAISPTVDIEFFMKPVYNFKASEIRKRG